MPSAPVALLLGFAPAAVFSALALPGLLRSLKAAGCVMENYRRRAVVNCIGLIVPLAFVVTAGVYSLVFTDSALTMQPILIMILAASLFGLVDDLFGAVGSKGFKGHFRDLLQGRLTTGAMKALGIGITALVVAASQSASWPETLVNAGLIALSVNLMNLLDLRPGRALKAFLALDGCLIVAGVVSFADGQLAGPAAGLASALVLLPGDIRERTMLGDVGSNALGAVIGIGFMFNLIWTAKLAVLILLVLVQLFAERYSITEVISKVPVLRRLDEWGRPE